MTLQKRIEGVKELLLGALFPCKKLNIIDHQRIQGPISGLEIVDGIVLQGLHHIADESLAVHVGEPCIGAAFFEPVGDRMHQMGFAQTHTAVNEQRVVRPARIARYLDRRRFGELIALALDEAVEGKIRIDPAPENRGREPAQPHCRTVGVRAAIAGRTAGDDPGASADVQHHIRHGTVRQRQDKFLDPGQGVLAQPFDDVAIRRKQPQFAVALDRLQGPHPRIELLLGKFALEHSQTAVP